MNLLDELILFIIPRLLRGMWFVGTGFVYLQFIVGLVLVSYCIYMTFTSFQYF